MAGVGPEDLHALADELLQTSIDALDTIPTAAPGLLGAPDRSFISPALPVFDCCEMLTVHVNGLSESDTAPSGLATGRRATWGRINLVGLVVSIVRCIPVAGGINDLPTIDAMQASAEQTNADAWAIWNHTFNAIRAEDLFALCSEAFWDGMRPITPSGGCGGWTAGFRVQLDGYEDP